MKKTKTGFSPRMSQQFEEKVQLTRELDSLINFNFVTDGLEIKVSILVEFNFF